MITKAKYIVYNNALAGETPIVFDNIIAHNVIASSLTTNKDDIVAAGFVEFDDSGAYCGGESTSLKVKSRGKKDAELINWRILRKGMDW